MPLLRRQVFEVVARIFSAENFCLVRLVLELSEAHVILIFCRIRFSRMARVYCVKLEIVFLTLPLFLEKLILDLGEIFELLSDDLVLSSCLGEGDGGHEVGGERRKKTLVLHRDGACLTNVFQQILVHQDVQVYIKVMEFVRP